MITILALTCNDLPTHWEEFWQKTLLEAANGLPIISLSMEPMNLGINVLQDKPKSMSNIYWQILRGAKMATTEYIGIAESDTLYPAEHFLHKPEKGTFSYNMTHWSLFTWTNQDNPIPTYNWRNRHGNYSMIAERSLIIDALEERFRKWPNGTPEKITGEMGRGMVERNLGITERKASEFYTTVPIINFNHDLGTDPLQRRHRKRLGYLRSYDVPYWGRAEELIKNFR